MATEVARAYADLLVMNGTIACMVFGDGREVAGWSGIGVVVVVKMGRNGVVLLRDVLFCGASKVNWELEVIQFGPLNI